jgi:hypothetical protein
MVNIPIIPAASDLHTDLLPDISQGRYSMRPLNAAVRT